MPPPERRGLKGAPNSKGLAAPTTRRTRSIPRVEWARQYASQPVREHLAGLLLRELGLDGLPADPLIACYDYAVGLFEALDNETVARLAAEHGIVPSLAAWQRGHSDRLLARWQQDVLDLWALACSRRSLLVLALLMPWVLISLMLMLLLLYHL